MIHVAFYTQARWRSESEHKGRTWIGGRDLPVVPRVDEYIRFAAGSLDNAIGTHGRVHGTVIGVVYEVDREGWMRAEVTIRESK